VLTFLQRY